MPAWQCCQLCNKLLDWNTMYVSTEMVIIIVRKNARTVIWTFLCFYVLNSIHEVLVCTSQSSIPLIPWYCEQRMRSMKKHNSYWIFSVELTFGPKELRRMVNLWQRLSLHHVWRNYANVIFKQITNMMSSRSRLFDYYLI